MSELPKYESSEEEFQSVITEKFTKINKKTRHAWIFLNIYDTANEAVSFVRREKIWSYFYTNKTKDGDRVNYRCNQVKSRETQCKSQLYLLYHAEEESVSIYKTASEHTCNGTKNIGIPEVVKLFINEQIVNGVNKPKRILSNIERNDLPIPKINQLNNYLKQYRDLTFGVSKISMSELKELCQSKSAIPVNDDESFILCQKIGDDGDVDDEEDIIDVNQNSKQYVRFFITTNRLLQIASVVHADATYKLY